MNGGRLRTTLRFAARRAFRRSLSGLLTPLRLLAPSPFGSRTERILIAPQDVRTSDPTAAADIYAGYFIFAGKAVSADGGSPFAIEPPSRAWSEALMGFGWLRDIRAADTALARANARTLVGDFIAMRGHPDASPAWDTAVVARRLISWLSHSPSLLDGADRVFYRRFMGSIRRQSTLLWRKSQRPDDLAARLTAAIALTYVVTCVDSAPRTRKRVLSLLISELKVRILPDGSHISRNPQMLIDLLSDLLPLRHCFQSQDLSPPPELITAIDRMMPLLRMLRHGDGSIATFNGMSATARDDVINLLVYQDQKSSPLQNALQSGYRRLQAGDTLILFDAGVPPPEQFSLEAHAGCLSFEMSDGIESLIVNCGAPVAGQEHRRMLSRATAAHSTVTLGDYSSCRFAPPDPVRWPHGGPMLSGPRTVETTRNNDGEAEKIEASHDGYIDLFGIRHHRSLTIGRTGAWIIGEDRFEAAAPATGAPGESFAIRFHLHPQIRVRAMANGTIRLDLPSGTGWTFTAERPATIEDSVIFASLDGLRRTSQIVIEGPFRTVSVVKWSLVRDGAMSS